MHFGENHYMHKDSVFKIAEFVFSTGSLYFSPCYRLWCVKSCVKWCFFTPSF